MDVSPRHVLCVRCGRRPRAAETYLCEVCLHDPEARREAMEVLRSGGDNMAQRRRAIETYGWAGGWGDRP